MKKLFVFDCDGTLLDSNRNIVPKNVDTINEIIKMGHEVCLCTGRNFHQLEKYLQLISGIKIVATLNGTMLNHIDRNESVQNGNDISREIVDDMIAIAKDAKRELHWSNKQQNMYRVYFGTTPKQDIDHNDQFFKVGTVNPQYLKWDDVRHDIEQNDIIHVSVKMEKDKITKYYEYMKQKYHDTKKANVTLSSEVYIDVSPYGANKATAVQYFQKQLGIDNENTYCFGDSGNDIEMFQYAFNPIAMENGTNKIKSIAKYIIGSNDSETISETLQGIISYSNYFKEIEPSLLAFDIENIDKQLVDLKNLNIKSIHYDVMDGFVNNKSFDNEWMQKIKDYGFLITVHLMVYQPMDWVDRFLKFNPFSISFQYEAISYDESIKTIDYIRSNDTKAGIAIKPFSSFNNYVHLLDKVDIVTIMTVEPGKGGQSFIESSLENLINVYNYRKQNNLKYLIQVDGGIKIENIDLVKSYADLVVSGTGFMKLENEQRKEFINKLKS